MSTPTQSTPTTPDPTPVPSIAEPRALPFRSPRTRFMVYHQPPDAGRRQHADRLAHKIMDLSPELIEAVEQFIDVAVDES